MPLDVHQYDPNGLSAQVISEGKDDLRLDTSWLENEVKSFVTNLVAWSSSKSPL